METHFLSLVYNNEYNKWDSVIQYLYSQLGGMYGRGEEMDSCRMLVVINNSLFNKGGYTLVINQYGFPFSGSKALLKLLWSKYKKELWLSVYLGNRWTDWILLFWEYTYWSCCGFIITNKRFYIGTGLQNTSLGKKVTLNRGEAVNKYINSQWIYKNKLLRQIIHEKHLM